MGNCTASGLLLNDFLLLHIVLTFKSQTVPHTALLHQINQFPCILNYIYTEMESKWEIALLQDLC